MRSMGQGGFTLPELLVVMGILIVVTVPGLLLIHPQDYSPQLRNAERRVALAEIKQAIKAYVAQNGSLPAGITQTMRSISSLKGQVNLCPALVPRFLPSLPVDPLLGSVVRCTHNEQYLTGYIIERNGDSTNVIVGAAASEGKLIYLR